MKGKKYFEEGRRNARGREEREAQKMRASDKDMEGKNETNPPTNTE